MKVPRLSLRLRLTLIFTGIFLVAGVVLVSIEHALLDQTIESRAFLPPPPPRPADAAGLNRPPPPPPADQPLPPQGLPPPAPGTPQDIARRAVNEAYRKDLAARVLRSQVRQSAIALTIALSAAAIVAWYAAGVALAPISRITELARRISERTLGERLSVEGPADELRDLAQTFNAMIVRLDGAFTNLRNFAANVSHELRTPLAVQRVLVDVTLADPNASVDDLRDALEKIRVTVDEGDGLIEALLVLVRAGQGIDGSGSIDAADAVAVSLERLAGAIADKQLEVRTTIDHLAIGGDERLIARAIDNLLQNAVRHNIAGGWIEVEVRADDDVALVRVANGGPVIARARIPQLFEPFGGRGRGRTRGVGMGLGLSIVRAIAHAHGGTIDAEAPSDGGLQVTLRLPLVSARS